MRLFALAMLMMFSIGAEAKIDVQIANDGKFDGGTIEVTNQKDLTDGVEVTITVTPNGGYTIKKSAITVVSTYPPSGNSNTRTPEIANNLTLYYNGSEKEDVKDLSAKRDYTFIVPSGFGAWVKEAKFTPKGRKGPGDEDPEPVDLGYSGTYYIGTVDQTNGFYLCPTNDSYIFYDPENNTYTTDKNGNPFLTTYKCKSTNGYNSSNALWIIEKHPSLNYYYIKHASDGKYLTYNDAFFLNTGRVRVHLEDSPADDYALFAIEYMSSTNSYDIISKFAEDNNTYQDNNKARKYLNINKGNKQSLKGDGDPFNGINTGGIIGLWTAGSSETQATGRFFLEDYITRPTISFNESNLIVITAQSGATSPVIKYTTNGTIPSITNGKTYSEPFAPDDDVTTIKAVEIVDEKVSNVATFFTPVLFGDNHKYLIQSQNNGWTVDENTTAFHFYMIPGDEENSIIKVNTTSLFRPTMEWYFLNAGIENGVQYYYVVNNGNGKYLCYDGTNKVYMDDYTNENRFKFKIVESPTAGTYNIYPYGQNIIINKATDNANNGAINTANYSASNANLGNTRWKFVSSNTLDKTAPFTVSDATSTNYYKIASVGSDGYYIVPPSGNNTNATTSNVESDAMKWYLEEAQAANETDWLTYYHIRNAETCDYLYFTEDANNAGACLVMRSAIEEGSEDRYMFTWAKTADANANYYIIPKNLKDVSLNQFSSLQRNGGTLQTNLTRGAGTYAWTFEPSSYKCETPVITYDPLTGKISITCGTSGATIYVAHYDSEPSSGDIPALVEENVYSGEFDALPGYYKAVASRSVSGEDMSDVTTSDLIDEFHCMRPIITKSSNHVTITCATPGASIYYIAGIGEFSENAANYGGTLYTESGFDTSETIIKAIAIKGGVWSTKSAEARYDKTPITITSGAQITNMDGVYIVGDSFTPLSTPIGSATDPFTGEFDGNFKAFEISHPLFAYVSGATIKNVILDNVSISGGTNAGAICSEATGDTRIYNCGVLASESTVKTDDDGYTTIISCSSTISGSNYVGGIVGLLDGNSRVINCFSYANITGGNYVGGIVGYNNVATTSAADNQKTMVMNCMFYGDIDYNATTSRAPIYNGEIITNRSDASGVSNFNYFWSEASYVQKQKITSGKYNCALAAETRYLQRFEFFRHLLNSNRELAAWWATGNRSNKDEIMKWVLEPSQINSSTPYPILKPFDKYPSVVNIDADNAPTATERNKGGKLTSIGTNGELQVTISGATMKTGVSNTFNLVITDKDPDHFNFNYGKVQLPYYNDYCTGNYTGNKVVTGWEVTVTGGSHDFTNSSEDADLESISDDGDLTLTTPYNFADRKSTQKDNYSTNGNRIFNQGAYFDVPEGVTSITIKPHWAKCVFVADEYMDVVYDQNMDNPTNVTTIGDGKRFVSSNINIEGTDYPVKTSMSAALSALNPSSTSTVYDNAIVLVGNVHNIGITSTSADKPFTIMSIDLDEDNEPDYSYILRFNNRNSVHPVRIDFLNVIGLGMAQKSTGGTGTYNFGIMNPLDWFEVTNTALFRVTQFEYEHKNRKAKPIILHGGVIEQWVSAQSNGNGNKTNYIHVGGNVWFKEFHLGWHQDNPQSTKHPPVSVTGGDFDNFYLTGFYASTAANYEDNAECYINGGRFGKVSGTGMEGIGKSDGNDNTGNIIWQIDNADIDEFYAGGINAAHIAEGNIYTVISNSRVDQFCGGPKFGDMNSDKIVVTNATNCIFRTFFGAGYGGNSYNRYYPRNKISIINMDNPTWDGWLQNGNTDSPTFGGYKNDYIATRKGVEARIDYQFIPMSDNKTNVARLFIDYVSFSLATTYNVTSKLTGCTITTSPLGRLSISDDYKCLGNFYGGGSLGTVSGPVKSTLINCTVDGNVFGAGYSATLPAVKVMKNKFETQPHYDENLGAYLEAELPAAETYTWEYAKTVNSTATAINTDTKKLFTTEDLTALGKVTGTATLNIDGTTTVAGNVYGGGEESNVAGNTQVTMSGGTIGNDGSADADHGNVFGGGKGVADNFKCDKAMVGVNDDGKCADPGSDDNKNKGTKVTISNGQVNGNVYGGGEVGRVEWNTQVTIGAGEGTPIINGSVFGAGAGVATHGYAALVRGNSTVTVQGNAKVRANVYGGGEQATVGRYWVKGINTTLCSDEAEEPAAPSTLPDEMPYKTRRGGKCTVLVQGNAQVGPDDGATAIAGHVFGAGKGVTPNYNNTQGNVNRSKRMVDYNSEKHTGTPGTTWDYYEAYTEAQIADTNFKKYVWEYFATEDKYFEFLQTLALVTGTDVTIGGGTVKGNVYGGSQSGFVQDNTDVKVTGGSIGTEGTTMYGNVFGGGKGLEEFAEAGKVKGTTTVAINNGTVNGNVYGGGELGDVGIIDKTNKNDKGELTYNYFWKQTDGSTANTAGNNGITGTNPNTGICTVTISGGTIGIDNPSDKTKHGNVFGAGRGSSETWWCEKAIVYATNVIVSAGTVKGNVYGGGEVGRVEDDAKVTIGDGDNAPTITGNVFGAGAGLMTHGYSALVRGNSDVTVQGAAQVGGSVYGGGETASVGRFTVVGGLPKHPDSGGTCKVTIQGNANIGTSGTGHNVFGACKGVTPAFVASGENRSKSMQLLANAPSDASLWSHYNNDENSPFIWRYYPDEAAYLDFLKTLALTSHPYVTISGSASVYGSVYGGGERGVTLGHVNVDITGGTVAQDVYGGGALADTNLGNWDENSWVHESKSAWYTTHVSLTGGTISGDAYGGGLGQKEFGTKGQAGYEPEIEAMVYGDVLVELNGKTTTENSTTTTTSVADDAKGCIVNRVFGCNNLNGTPKGKVQVYVYATQKSEGSSVSDKTKGSYDVQAVYGGGNLAKYEPVDATLIYNETNKATVDAARTEVYIDGCSVTSIKQVYGGGNAAPAPATYVEVRRAYEIDEVFGGGNGYDNYSLKEGNATVWYQNPGANVGYYTYAAYPKAGQGSGTQAEPYIAVETEKFSGGAEHKDNRLSITDPEAIALRYGSGIATLVVKGGTIHTSYGGSNSKGNVRTQLSSTYSAMFDDCDMKVGTSYGGGKNAYSDADAEVSADCAKGVEEMFGGSRDADFDGNINLTITNGSSLKRVFGGNNTSGAVNGSITVTIEEGGCEPIRIEELYLGGFLAPYSVYGYEKNEDGSYKTESVKYLDENNVEQTKLQRIPLESGTRLYNDPRINVISATYIGNIFGGGYQAKLVGNPHINVNMEKGKISEDYRSSYSGTPAIDESGNLPIGTIGNIYGGGNLADIVGDTYVEIGTGTWVTSWDNDGKAVYETIAPARNAATITGNVFGGGKGKADTFKCEKAMIGVENQDFGSTNVIIGNGTVGSLDENGKLVEGTGNVYGGGQIGRVELNTNVTIGLESGTSEPIIRGNVFGAGKGDNIHGYAALVRGNSTVTIQNNAKVGLSVYGGGEIASVGKYNLVNGFPVSLVSDQRGICSVTVKDNVEIGPDDMKMYHEGVDAADDKPDDAGHVFGGGKGILPYVDMDARGPGRIGPDGNWEDYTNDETKYFNYIKTLALVTQTTVNIEGNTFIKGSVYGGSENGLIQHDTHVFIKGGQIGNGDGINRRYTAEEWAYDGSSDAKSLKECAHWEYKEPYSSYDPFANATAPLDNYSSGASTEGGRKIASDGHTYYGNVFGGGSGSIPYLKDGISKYNSSAGTVEGDTYVEISGGHILTNVYGGCEATNVLGTANVTMTDGSIGVPRTPQQIKDHPVTCYLFGAGKGDQRIFFNKETNVNDAIVKVEGGTIYGSVFGGGEDGHVLRNTTVTIGKTDGTGPTIGTVGSTYVDGNVFGGGRGFGGEALTAGNIGGSVDLTIDGGTMLGSIYGGGRLASVGYGLYLTTEDGYGVMRKDDEYDGSYPNPSSEAAGTFYTKGRGHIKVTVNGGTIGKEFADDAEGEHSGNVFGGSMGRLTKLDGTPFDAADHWKLLATAKSATVNINGGTIKRSVYGGGEMGTVTENTNVTVSGGSIGTSGKGGAEFGNVYGGGKGLTTEVLAGIVKGNTKVTISSDSESPNIYHNIYGGGAYGSVGAFDLSTEANKASYHVPYAGMPVNWTANTGKCEVIISGGIIGSDGHENGMVFGSSRGDVATPDNGVDPNDLLAWVHDTHVTIGTQSSDEGPQINGSVYGSGENGHVFNNTQVDIHSGTVGILSGTPVGTYTEGGATYPFRGNVYGGGCGTDTYSVGTGDEKKEYFNPLAGIVFGNTEVTMDGGRVVRTVYGGGAMGSVGTFTNDDNGKPATCAEGTGLCTVSISGGKIGPATMAMPNNYGNVFGAGRGEVHDLAVYPNLEKMAYFNNTEVTISGSALVKGSVYGGSESGHVLNDTWVKIAGGQVGCGKDLDVAYSNWDQTSMEECPHWPYNEDGAAYDKYANEYDSKGGSTAATDGHTFYGNVFGGGSGYEPYAPGKWVPTAGLVEGNTLVVISGGHILTSVYGGNEQTDVNGSCTVTMSGGTVGVPRTHAERQAHPVTGNLFGAGKGDKRILFNTWTNVGSTVIDISGGRVYGSVFGGGEDGHVLGDAKTTIRGAEIGTLGTTGNDGNVFGGGRGSVSARTAGVVSGSVTLDIQDGLIMGSVYGGGRLASVGTYLVPTDDSRYGKQIPDGKNQIIGSANDVDAPGVTHGHVDITIAGGTIGALDADGKVKESANSIGDVYGGCKGTTEGEFHDKLGVSTNATVNLLGGTVGNSIYGGGEVGNVGELGEDDPSSPTFAKVNLLGGSVKNVYGGGLGKKTSSIDAKALVKGDVTVNLNGLEKDDYETLVLPNNINKEDIFDEGHTEDNYVFYRAKSRANGCKVLGNIFGCNNVNGSPTGHAKVHVFMTTPKTGQLETEYDISAIYGGGNQADYEPTDTKQSTEVIIEGCDLTKIQQVYGGGNAAASPGTSVLIKGTQLIDEVFGGGNGVSTETFENPGANVGYHTDKTPYTSGDGKANVQLMAGNVHNAYGGSNSNGDIRGGSSITKPTPVWSEGVTSCCKDLAVDQIFGGGKNADMRSGAEIVMGCMPDDWIGEIYAGAEMANVKGDVSLTLTSGKFGRVFGGNKTSGILDGSITVNIDENGACAVPIVIGELYGGGNMAAYSIFGYEGDAPRTKAQYDALTTEQKAALDLEEPHASPVVNVHGFTSIGNIFGGGFGADAKMYGNPTVNINEVMVEGNKAYQFANDQSANKPTELIDGENVKLHDHVVGNMGVINNVFGGGNAALVDGNTTVNIATEENVYVVKLVDVGNSVTGLYKRVKNETTGVISYELQGATDKAVEGSNYYQKQTVVGADIRGNVYGGGNEAEVTGNTNVVIGKRSE